MASFSMSSGVGPFYVHHLKEENPYWRTQWPENSDQNSQALKINVCKNLRVKEAKGNLEQQQAFGFYLLPFLRPLTWLLWVQGNSIRLGIRPKQAAEQPWLRI